MAKKAVKKPTKSSSRLDETSGFDNMYRAIMAPDQKFREDLKLRFGQWLRRAILIRGMTQSEFARAVNLPRDSISTYILGKTLPSAPSAKRIADFLGVDVEDLLFTPKNANQEPERPDDDGPTTPTSGGVAAKLDIQSLPNMAGKARIRLDQIVRVSTALKIAQAVEEDASTD